jgi:hypothetical protein
MIRAGAGCSPGSLATALLFTILAGPPTPAAAQDPVPVPRDTLVVPRDTLAADTLPRIEGEVEADSVLAPAVRFPAMPLSPDISAAGSQWVWDRETLLREAHVSLVDLLERIPGITVMRGGVFGQPEVAAVFGGTAARTEIEIDGILLDPLTNSTRDLSDFALGHLREVRVQRRLGVLRIILTTEFPDAGQPYTRVEAGIGVPSANLFRGLFMVPHVIIGPLALGIERLDTDGSSGRSEPAGLFSGWAKWAWTDGDRGVQFEWMRGTLRREPNSFAPLERIRQDFMLRARNRFSPRFAAELFAGRSTVEQTTPSGEPETGDLRVERESLQAGARAGLDLTWAVVNGSVRYRSLENLPLGEAQIDAETQAGPLRLSADAALTAWDGGISTAYAGVRGELGGLFATSSIGGASAFGEITRGTRGAPTFDDTDQPYMLSFRSGWRAGLALDLGRATGTVAAVALDQDRAWPFGLDFDAAAPSEAVGTAMGIEAHGRLVIWRDHLTLSSWITDWREAEGWTYLPSRSWRTALELHMLPHPTGNLEIFGRAEAHMRGSVLAFDAAALGGTGAYSQVPAYTTADAYLQIRVIDVRAFIRWEDILGNDLEELPGRIVRGPRIFYGVKWDLWN